MLKTFVKDNVLWLDHGKLELFTPQKYLGRINGFSGNIFNALGLVLYKYYEKETDKKATKVGLFNNPSIVKFYPVDVLQNVSDTIWDGIYTDLNENEYTKLVFTGNTRITDKSIVQNLDNVTTFTNILLEGQLDNNIPYQLLSQAFIKNMTMNNISLDVPAPVVDVIIMKLCRSKKDRSKSFSQIIGKDPKTSPIAYVFGKSREICAADSVFAALSFEDMNSMIDASLNMTQQEKEQSISPIEQIIKM